MVLEERMQEWLQDYCMGCSDSCCNSQKHRIYLDNDSVPLFKEKGIPFVNHSRLDALSLIDWKNNKNAKLFLKDGSEIEKPSVVEIPEGIFGYVKLNLYADSCPFYNKEKGCEVHEDPRRPGVCKQYPIVFLDSTDPEGRIRDIRVMKSCECLRNPETQSELENTFRVRIVDIK